MFSAESGAPRTRNCRCRSDSEETRNSTKIKTTTLAAIVSLGVVLPAVAQQPDACFTVGQPTPAGTKHTRAIRPTRKHAIGCETGAGGRKAGLGNRRVLTVA